MAAGVALHLAGCRRPLHFGHRGLEGGARICIEVAGGLAHRERFESPAHHEEVADLVPAVVEDEDAVARHRVHQALALETAHRVPDRRAAHAQVAADLLDVQLGAGREDLAQDEVADGPIHALAEALVQQRRDRRALRARSHRWHGAVFLARRRGMSTRFAFDT